MAVLLVNDPPSSNSNDRAHLTEMTESGSGRLELNKRPHIKSYIWGLKNPGQGRK